MASNYSSSKSTTYFPFGRFHWRTWFHSNGAAISMEMELQLGPQRHFSLSFLNYRCFQNSRYSLFFLWNLFMVIVKNFGLSGTRVVANEIRCRACFCLFSFRFHPFLSFYSRCLLSYFAFIMTTEGK